jgi:hypothetical protein
MRGGSLITAIPLSRSDIQASVNVVMPTIATLRSVRLITNSK